MKKVKPCDQYEGQVIRSGYTDSLPHWSTSELGPNLGSRSHRGAKTDVSIGLLGDTLFLSSLLWLFWRVHLVICVMETTDLFQVVGDLVTKCQDDNKGHIHTGGAAKVIQCR